MICRKCHTNNPDSSVYCSECGALILRKTAGKQRKIPWYWILACAVVFSIVVYFIFETISKSPQSELTKDTEMASESDAMAVSSERSEPPLIVGVVTTQDLKGADLSGLVSAVLSNDWIALPVWALLGGENLAFHSAESVKIRIEKGIWKAGDPIAIWQIEKAKSWNTPELSSWKQNRPLQWRSLITKDSSIQVRITSFDRRGSFISFPLPGDIRETGVFMQEGQIVGWTFPDWMEKGYLWAGSSGADLMPKIQVDQFYISVSSNCREAHFTRVLSMKNRVPASEMLEDFAEGFRMASQFAAEDVPPQIRSQSIIMHMHSLAAELIQNGFAEDVVRILDDQVLMEALDPTLVKDAVNALVEHKDYNRALQFLERFKKNMMKSKGQSLSGLDRFHAQVYKDWLRKIIDQGSYYSGMVAFEEARRAFPDDMELHLLGVEVAVAEKNWERARDLLQMRNYPLALRNWANELENTIKEIQENEEAITIRFNPGEKYIPVKVFLNGTYSLKCIIDTGATTSSIPSSAVEALKIRINQSTPVRLVSTAGGIAETYEITLKSVELEGFSVYNVEALIIDIFAYPDCGLLGHNFLNNFHIEIDNQKGILRLRKR